MPEFDLALFSAPSAFASFGTALETAGGELNGVRGEFDAATKSATQAWRGDAADGHQEAARRRATAIERLARAASRAGQTAQAGGEQMQAMVTALRAYVESVLSAGFLVLPGGLVQPGPAHYSEAAAAGPAGPAVLQVYEAFALELAADIEVQVAELTAVDAETAAQIEAVLADLAGVGVTSPPATPDPAADGFDANLPAGHARFGDLLHFTDPAESRGTSMEVYLTPAQLPTPGTRSQRPIPASLRPAGYGGRDSNHAKGHLLADTLGGPQDEEKNFVTLYHRFTKGDNHINETPMQQVEMRIRRVIEGKEPGVPAQNVRYRVEAIGDDRLPDKMRIVALGDRGYREVVTMPNW